MKRLNNNFIRNTILVLLIIFFFSVKTNFVKNSHLIISKNYDDRINLAYGFCSPEGIGYLRSIKKKYEFKKNPKIINYEHVPQNNWAILNTQNIGQKTNKIIFLNYPGLEYNIDLNKISRKKYELKDVEFLAQNFESIINIKILDNSYSKDKSIELEVFTIDKSLNKKIIKNVILKTNKNEIINLIFNELNLSESKLFFKLNNSNEIKNIILTLKNKYNLNDFKILDEFENCFFAEKL